MITTSKRSRRSGFSFTEAIFTVAIIGIMSAIVVTALSNMSKDANRIVVRQQQAAISSALNAWVMSNMRETALTDAANIGALRSLEEVRADYNGHGSSKARFFLLVPDPTRASVDERAGFLDEGTAEHFLDYTTNSTQLKSSALSNLKQHFTLPDWQAGEFPQVLVEDD
ncbi:MAG: type II secretion system protein [Verrucomicrobiaceae bacterium]|nr:type II secretion system protein [Verrucomicrobiaceae bacterium]